MTVEGRVTVAAVAELVDRGDCPLPELGDPLVEVVGEDACCLLQDDVKTTLVNFFSPLLNTLLWYLSAQSVVGEEQAPPPTILFCSLKTFQLPNVNPG